MSPVYKLMTDKLQLMLINVIITVDQFLNIKVSQGSVATRLRCDALFNHQFVTLTADSDCERILKIGQHLPKLGARIKSPVFWLTG